MQAKSTGRLEVSIVRFARLPKRPMIAAALSGVIAGVALGATSGPIGVVFGMWIGVGVGLMTGYVLAHDDETRSVRTRELDAIIGITHGSMGVGPAVRITVKDERADEEVTEAPVSSAEAWAAEWLTPPPPAVG
jgi:hypothetical protein